MRTRTRSMIRPGVCALFFLLGAVGSACADDAKPAYPAMAPVEQYRVASASEEIEMARSAAPSSISSQASILTLGEHRYETTLKGRNGFVCMVERSWGAGFDDTQFWNPKVRSPICFSPAAARSVLPAYLERTEWALAGASKADMVSRTGAELAAKRIIAPEPGAMAYMMSKRQYLGDDPGHWHPHLMLFFTHADEADWGANLRGSPVSAAQDDSEHITTLFLLVPKWSDGTPALMETH